MEYRFIKSVKQRDSRFLKTRIYHREVTLRVARTEIINPSFLDFSCPIVLCKEMCGGTRFCIEYQNLNNINCKT